ncbi:MAG: D-alanine--D-alanine ligase [Eubacteriales bacterium]|nr:D-alanine--D-alanine ligase [Eubacteriales bacterium]MDY3332783.1 D-alanine--D-alanine ligase family protein [Gallibacter sp.]
MIRLLILFGGKSSEHDVSCMSTASILNNIDKTKYEVTTVGITKEGEWFLTSATPEQIKDGTWKEKTDNKRATVNFDKANKGLIIEDGKTIPLDCVMIMMHGKNAEDGTMQGFWEIVGIPYTGPGVMASANGMDKVTAKIIAKDLGVNQAAYAWTDRNKFALGPEKEFSRIEKELGDKYPLFVKPANSGSSIGITRVTNRKELFEGIKFAAEFDTRIVIEEGIVGREIEVAVLGNRSPKASRIGEIFSANDGIYDYESKYIDSHSTTRIVTDLPEDVETMIRNTAVKIYQAFDCRGLSRVDFFYTEDGKLIFNEINTLPGFTHISMYPQLWEDMGLSYSELIDNLIQLAMEEK